MYVIVNIGVGGVYQLPADGICLFRIKGLGSCNHFMNGTSIVGYKTITQRVR